MAKAQQYFNARGPVPQDVSRPYQSIIEDFDRKMADARRAAEQKVAVAEPPPQPAPEPARPIVTSPVQPSAPTEPRVGQAEAPKPPSQTPARRTAPADVSRISPGGAAPAKTTAAPPVETMPAPVVNATDRAAHDGLFALLTGDVERATMLLPRAIEETPATRTQRRAMLTAYLGVAYGNLS